MKSVCNERNDLVEEKVQNMRIENGKYSFDLIQRTNELKIKWDKIQSIQDDIYRRFNEELESMFTQVIIYAKYLIVKEKNSNY